jgi:hypothetical protein
MKKKEYIDPEIKSIIEKHTGSIGSWGPKDIYVEIKDNSFTRKFVEAMESKGWYLEVEESDELNMFFHYGYQEKVIKDKIPIDDNIKKDYDFRKNKYQNGSWTVVLGLCLIDISFYKEFCAKWGFPPILLLIIGFILLIIGGLTWYIYWRCPVCGEHLGQDDNMCDKCKSSFE